MRVLCIGLDSRVAFPEENGYAVGWTREMARLVDEYVVLAEARGSEGRGPIRLAPNAVAYLVPSTPATYPFAVARFAQKLHAESPFDICTTEDPIRAGLGGALFCKRTGVPLNIEYHSFHINEAIWLRSKRHHRIYNQIAIWVAKRADSIRTYSPDQEPALLALGIPQSRMKAISPPCPVLSKIPREEARRQLGLTPDEEVVFAAGRMVPYKHLTSLLDAFKLLREKRPASLLIAGTGPAQAEWVAYASSLGLDASVKWLNQVAETDMVALYCAADAYVTTAVCETGPRTIMEALACGCPCVTTCRTGVVSFGMCVDNETSIVVDHDDAPGIAAAMERLLADPETARTWALEGKRRMEANHSIGTTARTLVELFRETVRRKQREAAPDVVGVED
jgi:glycosyltransferase involved in cell wall biosynthesis